MNAFEKYLRTLPVKEAMNHVASALLNQSEQAFDFVTEVMGGEWDMNQETWEKVSEHLQEGEK